MQLKKADIAIMAICTGLIVANLYYCQPLIVMIAKDFNIPAGRAGSLNYITQAGYATGLLFLVPLGDLIERKKQILITNIVIVISLICAAMAGSFFLLQIASFCIGVSTIVPQLILPLAASLASPEKRGKIVGIVMSGLLCGILLSRTVSGLLGAWLGWRAVFWTAAGICALLFVVMLLRFPKSQPNFKGSYKELMQTLLTLLPQPILQEACLLSSLSFAVFGAFWTTMVLHLSNAPFNYNSGQIGLFGLAGAAGAMAAPIAGRGSDKGNPRKAILLGIIMLLVGLGCFYIWGNNLSGMIVGVVIIDFGLQLVHVSNQTRVYALIPEARNRLNTIYMTMAFTGTALGSAFGLWLYSNYAWSGFCVGCIGLMVVAISIYLAYHKKLTRIARLA